MIDKTPPVYYNCHYLAKASRRSSPLLGGGLVGLGIREKQAVERSHHWLDRLDALPHSEFVP